MSDNHSVLAAMEEELGNSRLDSLPLADRNRGFSTYQPTRTRVVENADTKRASSTWNSAVKSGVFNDSDAAAVRGLHDLGGPRLHDRNARRLNGRPPSPPRTATRPPLTSSIMGGVVTQPSARSHPTSSASGTAAACPATCSPTNPSILGGAAAPPVVRLAPASSTTGAPATQSLGCNGAAQVGNGPGNLPLPLPAPSRNERVNGPPTPAPSPTAPTSGAWVGNLTQAAPTAAAPISAPKPGRGLEASRWATVADQSNPTTKGRSQGPDQGPKLGIKIPEHQATTWTCSTGDQISEVTEALSKRKVTDDNVEVRIEPKHIDPMTGDSLGAEFVRAARAWLSVDKLVGKKICGLYLGVKNPNCPVFEVSLQGGPRATHNLLDMLSQAHSDVFLDVEFRLEGNKIARYSLELESEGGAKEFFEGLADLRELTVQTISEEMRDLARASSDGVFGMQNARLAVTLSPTTITTVTYPFPAPIRKKCSVNSQAKRTDTHQGILIRQADGRRIYTHEELTRLRNENTARPSLLGDMDFIQAVKRGRHKKTDSEECVVGVVTERSSRSTDVACSSAVLGKVRQMVTEGRTWVSRNGETML